MKYHMKRPEGQSPAPTPTLFGMGYGLDAKSLLDMVPLEDRPTIEEAHQRLRDQFAESFPSLEAELQKLRAHALQGRKIK
jgi:hypothetical protein